MDSHETVRPEPFFARFLENQEFPQVESGVQAGSLSHKPLDFDQTMKYPSDADEIGPIA